MNIWNKIRFIISLLFSVKTLEELKTNLTLSGQSFIIICILYLTLVYSWININIKPYDIILAIINCLKKNISNFLNDTNNIDTEIKQTILVLIMDISFFIMLILISKWIILYSKYLKRPKKYEKDNMVRLLPIIICIIILFILMYYKILDNRQLYYISPFLLILLYILFFSEENL